MEQQSPAWASLRTPKSSSASSSQRRRIASGFSSQGRDSLNLRVLDVDHQDTTWSDDSDTEEFLSPSPLCSSERHRRSTNGLLASTLAYSSTTTSSQGLSYDNSGWSTGTSTPSSRPTSPKTTDFETGLRESRLHAKNGSLRPAISKRPPKESSPPSSLGAANFIGDWRGGFTGIVDVEASRSRRASTDSQALTAASVWISHPSSPVSSISAGDGPSPLEAARSSSRSTKRRSTEGSVRGGIFSSTCDRSRKLPNYFAQDTLLRKCRSESDPSPKTSDIALWSQEDNQTKRVSALAAAQTTSATAALSAPSLVTWGLGQTRHDVLTPLDENGGYCGEFLEPLNSIAEPSGERKRAETKVEKQDRKCSARLPLLRRRLSLQYLIALGRRSSLGRADDGARHKSSDLGDHIDHDLRAMRRKMQHISLGVRLNAMRAERFIKQRWALRKARSDGTYAAGDSSD